MSETVARAKAQRRYNLLKEESGSKDGYDDIEFMMVIAVGKDHYDMSQLGVRDTRKIYCILSEILKKIMIESMI